MLLHAIATICMAEVIDEVEHEADRAEKAKALYVANQIKENQRRSEESRKEAEAIGRKFISKKRKNPTVEAAGRN